MNKPKVIHLRLAPKDWTSNPDYVYIGRPGKGQKGYFGNPFPLAPGADRGSTLEKFETWARARLASDSEYRAAVKALWGKILICFCAPLGCHGDVLAVLCGELNADEVDDVPG